MTWAKAALSTLRRATYALLLCGSVGGAGCRSTASLPTESQQALQQLEADGPRTSAQSGSVAVAIRSIPLTSEATLRLLQQASTLPPHQQELLRDVARLDLAEAGYLMGAFVPPGRYFIGMELSDRGQLFVLRDSGGTIVSSDYFWVDPLSSSFPELTIESESSGSTRIDISFEGLDVRWHFVPRDRLESLLQELVLLKSSSPGSTHASHELRVHSQLEDAAFQQALLGVGDRAIPIFRALLGGDTAQHRATYDMYVFAEHARYEAVDDLLMQRSFRENGGFSSAATASSYLWYPGLIEPGSFAAGIPMNFKALFLHELFHLCSYEAYPRSAVEWPDWFAEGLAEHAVWLALHEIDPPSAKSFHRQRRAAVDRAIRQEQLPSLRELLYGLRGGDLEIFYPLAYLFVHAIAQDPQTLSLLIESASRALSAPRAAGRLQTTLNERLLGGVPWFDSVLTAPPAAGPTILSGLLDETSAGYRIESSARGQAVAILPTAPRGPAFSMISSFAYQPSGNRQADAYLGYANTPDGTRFLKIAVRPSAITLSRLEEGRWQTLGRADYDSELATGSFEDLVWHPLRIEVRSEAQEIRVTSTKGRWARFELKDPFDFSSGQIGFGATGSIVWFREVKLDR